MFIRRVKVRPNIGRKAPVASAQAVATPSTEKSVSNELKVVDVFKNESESIVTSSKKETIVEEKPEVAKVEQHATPKTTVCEDVTSKDPVSEDTASKDPIFKVSPLKVSISEDSTSKTPIFENTALRFAISEDALPKVPSSTNNLLETVKENDISPGTNSVPLQRTDTNEDQGYSTCEVIELPANIAPTPNADSTVIEYIPTSVSPIKQQSPLKRTKVDKEVTRSRRWYSKVREPPERSKMTMLDLIYWNPSDNPMKDPVKPAQKKKPTGVNKENVNKAPVVAKPTMAPAPRVKVDENGAIILDEESLIIEHAVPESYAVITEDAETNYSSFRERLISKRWTSQETGLFYKALSVVGTDFSLMAQLLRDRSRHELKLKFKREEKRHRKAIDKILSYSNANNLDEFRKELDVFYSEAEEEALRKKDAAESGEVRKRGRRKRKNNDSDSENCEPSDLQTGVENDPTTVDDSNTEAMVVEDSVAETVPEVVGSTENQSKAKRSRGRPRKKPLDVAVDLVPEEPMIDASDVPTSEEPITAVTTEPIAADEPTMAGSVERIKRKLFKDKPIADAIKSKPAKKVSKKQPIKRIAKKITKKVTTNGEVELQEIKDAVSEITETPNLEMSNQVHEVGANVTLEKVGRRWLQVPETLKPYKAKYSDFTVTDLDPPDDQFSQSVDDSFGTYECIPVVMTENLEDDMITDSSSSSTYTELTPLILESVVQQC